MYIYMYVQAYVYVHAFTQQALAARTSEREQSSSGGWCAWSKARTRRFSTPLRSHPNIVIPFVSTIPFFLSGGVLMHL